MWQPNLAYKIRHQHVTGPLAHGISLQGRELTRIAVDSVRGETARLRAGREEKFALGVQAEGTGYSFGRHPSDGRQLPGSGVHGEGRDAVVASVGSVQEFPRRRDLDLGAGVPFGVPSGRVVIV